MAAIFLLELGHNYYVASFPSQYIFCANMMKLAVIFRDLEQLYDY